MSVLNDNQKSDYTEIKSLKELTFFQEQFIFYSSLFNQP
mgnify:FL=1|jgi:hypothetical protein